LRGFVAERIAAFKVPVKILFSANMLPRNATGKILKNELKPLFSAQQIQVIHVRSGSEADIS